MAVGLYSPSPGHDNAAVRPDFEDSAQPFLLLSFSGRRIISDWCPIIDRHTSRMPGLLEACHTKGASRPPCSRRRMCVALSPSLVLTDKLGAIIFSDEREME